MWNIVTKLLLFVFLFSSATPLWSKPKRVKSKKINLRSAYKKALSYEKKNKVKTSARLLKVIIKKYPAFKPARISLARIYAKRGLFSKAWRLWKKIKIKSIAKKDIFYYGVSAFSLQKYDSALAAFQRVSNRSKNYPNALFYAGVCQFRAKRYEKARKLLLLTSNISPPLQSTRRKLLIETRRRLRSRFRTRTSNFRQPTIIQQPVIVLPYQAEPIQTPTDRLGKSLKEEKKPIAVTVTGNQIAYGPLTGLILSQKEQSNHGISEKRSNQFNYFLGGSFEWSYLGKPKKGGQPSVGVYTETKLNVNTSDGESLFFTTLVDRPDEIRVSETQIPDGFSRNLSFLLRPSASYPLSKSLTVSGVYSLSRALETDSFSVLSGDDSILLNLGFTNSNYELELSLQHFMSSTLIAENQYQSFLLNFDKNFAKVSLHIDYRLDALLFDELSNIPSNAAASMKHSVTAGFDFSFEYFTLTSNLLFFTLIEKDENIPINGYLSQTSANVGLNIPLPINLSIQADGGFVFSGEYFTNTLVSTLPNVTDPQTFTTAASSSVFSMQVGMSFNPVEFINASLSYKLTQTTWEVANAQAENVFQQETPDFETEFNASLNAFYRF